MMRIKYRLNEIINYADITVDKISEVNKMDNNEILIFGYFLSLLNTAKDIEFLKVNNRMSNISILIRSFFETYVDLKLIVKDKNYIRVLILKAYKEELKMVKAIIEDTEGTAPSDKPIFTRKKSVLERDIRNIEESKPPHIKGVYDKFEKVDLEYEYKTMYNDLCSYSHNSISRITERHIDASNPEKTILKHVEKAGQKSYNHHYSIIEPIFLDSIEILVNTIGVDCPGLMDEMKKSFPYYYPKKD